MNSSADSPWHKKGIYELETLLLDGLKGQGTKVTPTWWEEFRAGIIKRHMKSKPK
jgi:hypothetical protein